MMNWWILGGWFALVFLDPLITEILGEEVDLNFPVATPLYSVEEQAGVYETDKEPTDKRNPEQMWDSNLQRTGFDINPKKVLDGIANSAPGRLDIEAFPWSYIWQKTRYIRARQHWRQGFETQKVAQRVDVADGNWGGSLLDFATYESQVLRLDHSSTRWKLIAVRYACIVSGKADFGPCGLRYKLLLFGTCRSREVTGLLPFGPDLVNWIRRHFHPDGTSISAREHWCALNLVFSACWAVQNSKIYGRKM